MAVVNPYSFDRLVATISQNERKDMLARLRAQAKTETISLEAEIDRSIAPVKDIDNQFSAESLFLRIWLFLKALFLNSAIDNTYKAYLLGRIAKRIAKKYSGLVDTSRGVFLREMYDKSIMLKRAADFFSTTLSLINSDPGNFYVFLGTFFVPLISERFKAEVDPYNFPLEWANPAELHITQVRKLEKIMQTIDQTQRAGLYSAIQSANWLRQFCNLPFKRFLTQFGASSKGSSCKFSAVSRDINEFAKVLCNGQAVPRELLEALYLFNNQTITEELAEEEDLPEYDAEAAEFISDATERLKEIHSFIESVPLQSIGALVYRAADWKPAKPEGVDDWFTRFKANWRKIFDRKWASWLTDQRRENVRHQLATLCGLDDVPLMPNRPWNALWGDDVPFKFDYALGFLAFFFKNIFPKYTQILKIVLLEGKFYQNDHRQIFTDALDNLLQQEKNLDMLISMLDEKGAYGILFSELAFSASMSKQKVTALMEKIETNAGQIIVNFSKGCSALATVLDALDSKSVQQPRAPGTPNVIFPNEKTQLLFRQKLTAVKDNISKMQVLLRQIGDMSDSERELQEIYKSA
jgi:hypothetical protein